MTPVVAHSLYLSLSTVFAFFWTSSPELYRFNLQVIGALTLAYFAFKFFFRSNHRHFFDISTIIILNIIIIFLINSSGGPASPLFFLLVLLFFAIALVFEPVQASITCGVYVLLFLIKNIHDLNLPSIVNLATLLFTSPLASMFSKNYLEMMAAKGKIQILEQTIKETEEESLLWIHRQAKPSLASILNSTTDLVMYFNAKAMTLPLPPAIPEKLKSIQQDLITLYTSAGTLEKNIEEKADSKKLS